MRNLTAVVADDHQLIRDGLVKLLNAYRGMEVVGEADNGISAVTLAKTHKPDLMTLDIAMPHAQGIAVYTEVRRWSPDTKIAVFSGITSVALMRDLYAAGAHGMFTKRSDISEFEQSIPILLKGGRVISADAAAMIDAATETTSLSAREQQILSLIANGQTTKTIAKTLGLSPKTVENHRSNIMSKLEVGSMAELLAYALREGLLDSQNQL
ncbi:two component transcriptional regulator, LuxR family [Cognatiyoonia sediminum]|uniref:Two component transcriptional regulator, LuxR family n=1 Tax=Cognatiyoonia sediminum TaxID=1508389 RepID=A0A1M5RUC5_9RHOB|nr:response regulator transcription factor [Cognatiyoonia sediminum]SHH29780.1 two component transcriptional regulator, LuxR family [Cognatiyoonia sediminum]